MIGGAMKLSVIKTLVGDKKRIIKNHSWPRDAREKEIEVDKTVKGEKRKGGAFVRTVTKYVKISFAPPQFINEQLNTARNYVSSELHYSPSCI
jgi:hypothetical protein